MPRQPSRRHDRGSPRRDRMRAGGSRVLKQKVFGIVLIVTATMLAAGIIGWAVYTEQSTIAIDDETMCPLNTAPAEVTTVLVDASDLLSPVQVQGIRNEIEGYRNNVPRYGALEIYAVGQTQSEVLTPLFKACNPGGPNEISELTASVARETRKWREGFVDPLETALSNAMPNNEQTTSPIMESIQSVAVTAFGPTQRRDVFKRLVVISDMMQNTGAFSNYKSMDYEQFNKVAGERMMVNLKGVVVDVLYVRRASTARWQGEEHVRFWQRFFADQGATLARVYSISG